jgi:predicted MPP superfamily phosphohydrolase
MAIGDLRRDVCNAHGPMIDAPKRRLLTRRRVLGTAALLAGTGAATAGYATALAPFSERITRYALTPPGWTPGLKLRLAVLTDLHICEPWLGLARLDRIVATTNALGADAILLLGDYVPGVRIGRYAEFIEPPVWAAKLSELKAPLGVHAVLGNHDWWEDAAVQRRGHGPTVSHTVLKSAGIRVHENTAIRLSKREGGIERPFWLAGLGDQWAFFGGPRFTPDGERNLSRYRGVDDLPGTLQQVTDTAPVVLMVHEPDIFVHVSARVSLTLAGHTHGGQVRLLGWSPIVPSRYRDRFAYGHVVEDGRHLIVSSGLGVSGLPVRFGAPQEIVQIDLG